MINHSGFLEGKSLRVFVNRLFSYHLSDCNFTAVSLLE